nr:hypothetical protein [Tanacetum cinerariifolium]
MAEIVPLTFQSRIEAVLYDGHLRSCSSGLGGSFWDALDELVRECPSDQRQIIGGDLNGHIGAAADGYAGVHGGFGYGARNEEGRTILEFATAHDLVVANSFFKESDAYLMTFQSGCHNTQIDYLLVRKDVLLKRQRQRRARTKRPRILWNNLNGDDVDTFRATFSEKLSTLGEDLSASDTDQMWNTLAHCIKDAAKDSVGVTRESSRTHSSHKESWWFSEEVQTKIEAQQARFRELLLCHEGNQEDRAMAKERYKVAKRKAKIAVAQAKDKAYEDLYKKLDSKEGANDIYMIAKARERKRRDLGNIRGGEGCITKDGEKQSRRLEKIPIEAWRYLRDEGVKWLTCLFNKIFSTAKMPGEWRLSEVIPIYKNKGNAQVCSNYMGIKLLGHTMKLWERVVERRLRRETRVSENQFGFMLGRSTTEAIHLLRNLMDKYRERQRDLHMAFLDLEKAYDSIPRELIWRTLIDKGSPRRYLRVIKDMYDGAKTRVRSSMGNTDFFPVEVGLHQGSAISPYIFALILDELSRGIQGNIPWSMVFTNDIVLVAESGDALNMRMKSGRNALEDKGLRISRDKTEYLRCDFGRYEAAHGEERSVRIGGQILQPNESFRYLGLVIHRSGRIDEDVTHRIRNGWMRWRAASRVLCDKRYVYPPFRASLTPHTCTRLPVHLHTFTCQRSSWKQSLYFRVYPRVRVGSVYILPPPYLALAGL